MVEQAARVQASNGPIVTVLPLIARLPAHVLQSAFVETRFSPAVSWYGTPLGAGCGAWPAGWIDTSAQVPSTHACGGEALEGLDGSDGFSALAGVSVAPVADGLVGLGEQPAHPRAKAATIVSVTNEKSE